MSPQIFKDAALNWMMQNRRYALSVGGPGECEVIADVERNYVLDYGELLVNQNDGNCMEAAIKNAKEILVGRKIGSDLHKIFYEESQNLIKIEQEISFRQDLKITLELRMVTKR